MIGTSIPEYIFIRLAILLLRLVAPASILYLLVSAYIGRLVLTPWLSIIAVPEAVFFLCFYLPRKKLMQRIIPVTEPQLTRKGRQVLFNRCASCLPDSAYPLGWFLSQDIKRDNVEEWLLWALFSATPEDAYSREEWPEWNTELSEYIDSIEKHVNRKFERGRNEQCSSMRIAFDRVAMCHRPLIWYAVVGIVDLWTASYLTYLGFKHYAPQRWFHAFPFRFFTLFSRKASTNHFPYWYRPHTSTTKKPVVFIHGIGIGLYPYVSLFHDLITSDPTVGILLIELLPISMRISYDPFPSRGVMLNAIESTLDDLDIKKATLAGHSFGTVVASWVFRSWGGALGEPQPLPSSLTFEGIPEGSLQPSSIDFTRRDLASRFTSLLLIDPIPILLHLPDVAYNFLYRVPKGANQWQLWYFASRDPDVARTLGRYFLWRDCILWKEDFVPSPTLVVESTDGSTTKSDAGKPAVASPWPGRVAVILSGADQIVASSLVWRYLTGTTINHAEGMDVSMSSSLIPISNSKSTVFYRWASQSGDTIGAETTSHCQKLQVLFYPGIDHATVFDTKERRDGLVRVLVDFVGEDS